MINMLRLFLFTIQIGVLLSYCDCAATKKVIHISPELAAKIIGAVQKCQPETGINFDAVLMIADGKYREDQQFKDFIFCTYKITGFLHKNGELNQDKAIKAFNNEPLVEEGIRRCSTQEGNSKKDNLFIFFKCFADTVPVRMTI